jgi:hypothetical protein
MNNHLEHRDRTGAARVLRIIRGFAEASLVAVTFALAILVIGTPIALLVRALHDGLSWLVGLGGDMAAMERVLVSVGSTVGGIALTAVFARAIVVFFHWPRTVRERVTSAYAHDYVPNDQATARTAA